MMKIFSNQQDRLHIFMIFISGLMLGFAFPPFKTGIFAAFAFVPFFIAFESVDSYGQAFRYTYLWMIIVHIVTLYWTGGFTHCKDTYMMVAGILLLLFHPLFYFPAIALFIFIRKQFGFKISVLSFPFIWLTIEYSRTLTEFSFPWLTLGNTQVYDLAIIQISAVTGVYGLSVWLLILNVVAYFLYMKMASRKWNPVSLPVLISVLLFLFIYLLPKIYGTAVLNGQKHSRNNEVKAVKIGIVQPNIDPFEKWSGYYDQQVTILQQLTDSLSKRKVDIVLWPETAVPFYILHPLNRNYFDLIKNQIDKLGVNLLSGIPDIIYYAETDKIPKSSKLSSTNQRFDTFNSTILLQHDKNEIQKYAKIILVPFAERVPYSEELNFLNAMQWNFGLGGWGIGKDTTIFYLQLEDSSVVRFSNMICYESIFPGFAAGFVRKGAQFLTIITNDSWWGNTSGAYQHAQYAVLRAVENRRWVARCANGGISFFADPYGHILEATNLFERTSIVADIYPEDKLSFYSKNGDWLPEICTVLGLFMLMAAICKKMYFKLREKNYEIY